VVNPAVALIEIWRGDPLVKQISDISEDVINEMIRTQPLFAEGVAGLTLKLDNQDAGLTGDIIEGDTIRVFLYRQGDASKKVFDGKVVKLGYEGDFDINDYYMRLVCEDHGEEALAPPSLPLKNYVNTGATTILNYLMGLLTRISLDATDNGSEMASSHDMELNEAGVYNALVELMGKAQTSGSAIGFDGYVDPSSKLHVFKRGNYTSSVSLTGKIYHYKKWRDTHRIRNKHTVYGAQEKTCPAILDAWCEQTASETPAQDGWTAFDTQSPYDPITISWGTTEPVLGNEYITLTPKRGTNIFQDLPSITSLDCTSWKRAAYKKLVFWIYVDYPKSKNLAEELTARLSLYAPDENNYYISNLNFGGYHLITSQKKFLQIELPFEDPCNVATSPVWQGKVGSPNWANVQKIKLYLWLDGLVTLGTPTVKLDGFHFAEARYSYTANDPTSQGLYGTRCEKPSVDDNLKSDLECQLSAEEIIARLKDPITTIEKMLVEGDNSFVVGYKQPVVIAHDSIDANFLITQIRDIMHYTKWDTELTFGMMF